MNTGQLAKFCSSAVDFVEGLNKVCAMFEIYDGLRLQHFLAQVGHESAGFTRLEENLNYSVEGLLRIWPSRFAGVAESYAHKYERIANRAYANRLGNGPEFSGDGWHYRGRGLIQLTGKDNYHRASLAVFGDARLLTEPDKASGHLTAPLIAGWFWRSHKCNEHADQDNLEAVTLAVNGGLIGLPDRMQWLDRAKECFP